MIQIPVTSGLLAQPQPPFNTPSPINQLPPATWTSATDLRVKDSGGLRQSLQHPDIKLCISEAVNRANANLFLVDPFPDLKTRNTWLENSLAQELTNHSKANLFLREVNTRAKMDNAYFNQLFTMVREFRAPCGTAFKNPL